MTIRPCVFRAVLAALVASLVFCGTPSAARAARDRGAEKSGAPPAGRRPGSTRERRARERAIAADIAAWARGLAASRRRGTPLDAKALEAKGRIAALPEGERFRGLARALLKGRSKGVRLLAARQLLGFDPAAAVPVLALAAVNDRYRSVRDASLRTLRSFKDLDGSIDVGGRFIPYLASPSPQRRIRAANALSVFPVREAVPVILETMRKAWSGFGRGFFAQITQRAYIADYELVSGGTGFSIVEVADPVVRTVQTGVALDVKVRRVEVVARLRALVKITGEDFGTDLGRWEEWWRRQEAERKAKAKAAKEKAAPAVRRSVRRSVRR